MIEQKTIDRLRARGVQILASQASAGVGLSELMCSILCDVEVDEAALRPLSVGFTRAIMLTRQEAVALMETGLAGLEDPKVSIERWHRQGDLLYHNFLRRPDGSLIMDTMSAAEMVVGDPAMEQEFARSLLDVMGPYLHLGSKPAGKSPAASKLH